MPAFACALPFTVAVGNDVGPPVRHIGGKIHGVDATTTGDNVGVRFAAAGLLQLVRGLESLC
jgi:hypothetical protein